MKRYLLLALVLLFTAGPAAALSEKERYEAAKDFFQRFVFLENHYDMALIDMYADEARIIVIELRGDKRYSTEMTGKELKEFYAAYLKTAAFAGEWYTYTNVSITPEGEQRMRILATRTANKGGGAFPYQMLVGPGAGGRWQIFEEQTIVQPN